jgi:hypothetical protein
VEAAALVAITSAKQERSVTKAPKQAEAKAKWQSFIICAPKRVYAGLSRVIWHPSFRLIRETVSFFKRSIRVGAVEQIRNFSKPREFRPRDLGRDVAHALTGPVD